MTTPIDLSQFYTVPQAAAALGVTRARVAQLIEDKLLADCRPPSDLIPRWLIPKTEIERRKADLASGNLKKGGWPKGKPRKEKDLRKAKKPTKSSR